MRIVSTKHLARNFLSTLFAIVVALNGFPPPTAVAQIVPAPPHADTSQSAPVGDSLFRLETLPVGRDAQLLTVFGSLEGLKTAAADSEVPLVSILRDTLGDENTENDRLRYVWMLTYTRPSLKQRVASGVPFLYARGGDKKKTSTTKGMPPSVLDLADPERDVWQRFMWLALQNIVVNPYGVVAKTSSGTLRRNSSRYRQAHILRALAILSLYEAETGKASVFTTAETRDIQARLMLTSKTFGGLLDDAYLDQVFQQQTTKWLDTRGHNWELLRQRAEAEGLYFEPLEMPDGGATHALLWVAREDLAKNKGRKFGGRFLNIANPWNDSRLASWDGFTETRYFDAENRVVTEGTEGARSVELIPLALYGLEHPKIPALLVDFRDNSNPKKREMSHRVLEDVTRNVLALSRYGDIQYFLGRTVYDFVTSRRGMDVNQPTRLRAYSQLKLLLSLDATLDRGLRDEIEKRLESVSLNPLENDLDAEARLAREQYAALIAYAKKPDGLAARLDRDRRAEMVPLEHGGAARVLLRSANILSFGRYKHREKAAPEIVRQTLDDERRLAFHKRFLQEVAKSSPLVEVVWNIEDVRRSLRFVAEAGERGDARAARTAAKIFAQTKDPETRRLCIDCLYRINNETAKSALLRIYKQPELEQDLRQLTAQLLRDALREDKRIAPEDAKAIISVVGQ
ncbi:MAG: hypothetical protein H7Z38_10525 [Rubrivivax sp.]|nr:hypothetical protein [Pyrinomonadaceae bacterium]